ncbi:MAG: DUF2267 domain-containing protein [Bellilinea sp.]
MDELVALVVKKTGLSEEVARKAVATVIDFLKKKLPAPLAGQIDLVLGKGGGKEALAKALGNLTGKK